MNFIVNLYNHNKLGQRSLEDVIGIFGNQLRALGHEVLWFPENANFVHKDHGINVVVEGFTEYAVDVLKQAHNLGCRFICLATEEPTPLGFNHGRDREMVWRQKIFPQAAQYFEGIFCLVPGEHVTRWYGQFAPAEYIELGYADSLVRNIRVKPVFNFGFFGSISKRREKILRRLARYIGTEKAIRICSDFPQQHERDEIMRQAKVILQIRKYDEMGLVSSSRCNTALCNGRPVIAEPHALSKPWDEIIWFAGTMESFYDEAIMASAMWEGIYQSQMDKFKKRLPPKLCVGEPLAKIGLTMHTHHKPAFVPRAAVPNVEMATGPKR